MVLITYFILLLYQTQSLEPELSPQEVPVPLSLDPIKLCSKIISTIICSAFKRARTMCPNSLRILRIPS